MCEVTVTVPNANTGGSVIWKLENQNPKQTEFLELLKKIAQKVEILPYLEACCGEKQGRKGNIATM